MKSLFRLLLIIGILPMLFLTSCKEDTVDPQVAEFETLSKYMAQNALDLPDVLSGWVTSGSGLNVDQTDYSVSDYYIIDLRSAEDFAAGQIKDAHNTSLINILDEAKNANGQPILVVCYTGQTAGRGVAALRLMGYEAKSLKWGMSGWHSNFAGKWNANAGDFDHANWLRTGDPKPLESFNDPILNTYETVGSDILEARVQSVLQNSSWLIGKEELLGNPSNYFVINKWPVESWNEFGHVNGAYRIDETLNLEGLNNIDPAATSVVYCYTGQTSAISTFWLDVMGYNVKSLKFGANSIVHSELLVGTAGNAPKKSWLGAGSGSEMNYGYYVDGILIDPN